MNNYKKHIEKLKRKGRPYAIITTCDPDIKIVIWSYKILSRDSFEEVYNTKTGRKYSELPSLKRE